MSLLTKEQMERGDRYRELYSKHVQHPDGIRGTGVEQVKRTPKVVPELLLKQWN